MMVIPLPLTLTLAPIIGYPPTSLVWLPPFLAMTFLTRHCWFDGVGRARSTRTCSRPDAAWVSASARS